VDEAANIGIYVVLSEAVAVVAALVEAVVAEAVVAAVTLGLIVWDIVSLLKVEIKK
jgi:hypothetical protein